jgi:copper chaperone NosL
MDDRPATRRTLLSGFSAGALLALAGCTGGGADVPDPVDLSGGKFDFQGGMEIGHHGGPNGQIFYESNDPETPHSPEDADVPDNLAWFHTLVFGLFPYHFERLDRGWEARVIYVTDYSVVDYDLPEGDENLQMPSPTAAETVADAETLTFVAESEVTGGMGAEVFPFSDAAEADAFVDTHGGRTVQFDDIDRQLIDALQTSGSSN